MEITREKAWDLFTQYVDSESLIKHSLAVEASMIKLAKIFDEDVETWSCCGLLHDIDFQKYPEQHPIKGPEILREAGYPEEFCLAVKGHSDETNTPRTTKMAKTLYAVDQLSSFVVACALVRPTKFEGMKVKSVKKKMKDKAFARAVDRDGLKKGAEELGIELSELTQYVIDGLMEREEELNKMGMSLI